MNNLMIDLETLGTDPDAPVISIGAVFFDKNGLGRDYQINLDIDQQLKDGRKMTASTFKWWLEQSGAAQKVFKENFSETKNALTDFSKWITSYGFSSKVCPWGNGSGFDITIMEHIFKQYGVFVPWKFWNIRDLRTFAEYVYNGKDMILDGVAHNALDDAKHQARIVVKGMSL